MTDAPKFRCDRMEKLADYLETVPERKFYMGSWNVETDSLCQAAHGVAPECGFSGCAIGWAIHGKLFRDLVWDSKKMYPKNRQTGDTNYDAIAKVFGIDATEAQTELFGPYLTGTPKEVAKRIRKFADRKCRELANEQH
jgi:hypothetical protein